jgi:hypothetical protein
MDTKYNGWTNYATWRVNLEWFDGMDGQLDADGCREYVEDAIEQTTQPGFARDYVFAFLSDVNWHEIAEHYQDQESDDEEAA